MISADYGKSKSESVKENVFSITIGDFITFDNIASFEIP
jgi:hypothetical protein